MSLPALVLLVHLVLSMTPDCLADHSLASADDSDYILSFQHDGYLNNQTWASINLSLEAAGAWSSEGSVWTLCYWFNIHYHRTTISLFSYCGPSVGCDPLSSNHPALCSNIQYHFESKKSDMVRVEFSVSHVKTKTLYVRIKPKQWNHHCFIYSSLDGQVAIYSNGVKADHALLKKKKDSSAPSYPTKGIIFLGQEQEGLCSGFDDYDALSADISQFQIWDHVVSGAEILEMAQCRSKAQGNLLSWAKARSKWVLLNVDLRQLRSSSSARNAASFVEEMCDSETDFTNYLVAFTEKRTIEMAELTCKVHGGRLPVPRNILQNDKMAELSKQYESVCSKEGMQNLNQPYMWLGIEDPDGYGRWKDRYSKNDIHFALWDQDEGNEGDTCARMQGNGIWRDTVCKKTVRHCTICHIIRPYRPFKLRGICAESNIDRDYFLITAKNVSGHGNLEDNNTSLKPIYEGYFSKIQWHQLDQGTGPSAAKEHPSGFWELVSRIPNDREYCCTTNATSQVGYPVGRHLWLVTDPKCSLFTPTWLNMTFSICSEDEFTCNDGLCVPSSQRCDLVANCPDLSDELECHTVFIPDTYLQNPPTDPKHADRPVTVSLSVSILNIDKIDTAHMMFALTMMVSLVWKDHRLNYKNLREGTGHNRLSEEEIGSIWIPKVSMVNAKIGQLQMDRLGVMVQREADPKPFSYEDPVEDKIYSGSQNSLVMTSKMYVEYGCTFDLRSFPFDSQQCAMNFSMDSAKANYIVLDPEDIMYQGDCFLLEFFVKNVTAHGTNLITDNGHSMVTVLIEFHRELGNMVNTYFQTFLLCLMAYLTLYINLADFGNRFMGALTTLLVLASLLASIEENLPKTSYFKKIDIWFMSYIIFIFIIIMFHIVVDSWIKHDSQILENSHTHIMARRKRVGATNLNNLGKIIFPIILGLFSILYFVLYANLFR